ncbi:MAG: hypothetical protein AABZ30_02165, partial [Myxococcota bacterium]
MRKCAAISLVVLGAAGAARADIALGGTQPGTLTETFASPDECSGCHRFEESAPWDSWAGSMMANAARDPVFLGALTIANQDVPRSGDFCIRCHSPQAFLEGRAISKNGSAQNGAALTGADRESVHCEFCHRITEGPDGELLQGNGQYFVADDHVRRGPYAYPDASSSFMGPAHMTAVSELHASAALCGVCHDVTSPLANLRDPEDGADLGFRAPIERTFTEWTQSAYPAMGVTCQTCHMPEIEARACKPQLGGPVRPRMSRHNLAGGNAWVPDILAGEEKALDRAENYAQTKQRAIETLQSAATLAIDTPDETASGETMAIVVSVTNLTGHKLPTGYPEGRRMWLQVEARVEGAAMPFFVTGAYDGATGALTLDDQAKVYEVRQAVWDGAEAVEGFHFMLN